MTKISSARCKLRFRHNDRPGAASLGLGILADAVARRFAIVGIALFALACGASDDSIAEHHAQQRAAAARFGAEAEGSKQSNGPDLSPDPSARAPVAVDSVDGPVITVYKTPSCGCCKAWVDRLRSEGFRTITKDLSDVSSIKTRSGVPHELWACHTATIGGYVIEGHVPAQDIRRLLADRPDIRGLAVPGMPIGSPGMEIGTAKESYDVLSFDGSGKTDVFSKH